MNHYLSHTDYALWFAGLALELFILAAGIYQKHYRRHPAFLSFIAISALKTTSLMYVAAHCTYATYYSAYWLGMVLKSGFLGWLVWEIFRDVFKSFRSVPKSIQNSLITMAFFAIFAVASLHSFFPAYTLLNALNRSINFGVILLMWSVIYQSDSLYIPKTVTVYGICAGLLFTLLLDGMIELVGWEGIKQQAILRMISMGGFIIAECVWFRHMLKPPAAVDVCAKKQVMWVASNLQYRAISNVSRKIS